MIEITMIIIIKVHMSDVFVILLLCSAAKYKEIKPSEHRSKSIHTMTLNSV